MKNSILALSLSISGNTIFSQITAEEFNRYIKTELSKGTIAGMGIAIVTNDSILLSKGYGYADIQNKIPFSNKLKKLIKDNKINFHYPMSSGDDYELLFTAHPKKKSIINNISKIYKIKISKVGKIIGKNGLFLDGSKITNIKKSYQHFF